MSQLSAGLLLAAIALVVVAYVVACDYTDRDPHDGPWILAAAVLITSPWGVAAAPLSTTVSAASVAPRESAPQGEGGPCLVSVPGAAAADSPFAAAWARRGWARHPAPGEMGSPGALSLSYRGESWSGSTEPATTSAAPAGESRPSWGRGTDIGPRALASAPGEPLALIPGAPIVPVEHIADDFGRDLAWLGAGVSADLFSTSWALHRCQRCSEGNPFGVDGEARVALKVAMTSSSASICWWLRRHGHPRLATITRWSIFGVQALAAAQNTVHAVRGR